jgi:DNA polymerase elongation subunit (family B)
MKFYTNVQLDWDGILYRGVDGDQRITQKVKYKPSLFVPVKEPTKYKTLDGKFVERIQFDGISDAREWVKEYEEYSNTTYYGNKQYQYTYISDNFQGHIDYDISKIVIANLDIEVASENGYATVENANEKITAITIKAKNNFYVFGCGDFTKTKEMTNVHYFKCKNELDLLEKFLSQWQNILPDIITGWNVAFYDVPYLINRITLMLGEDAASRMSPWKKFSQRTVILMGKQHTVFDIVGVGILDYLEMYKKFPPPGINPENYKLNTIARLDLKKEKLSYDEYSNLYELYQQNFQKFIEYNIRDVELVDELEAKHKLIEMVLSIAYDAKVNYNDVFTQVRMWDTIVYNYLRNKNIVVPQKKRNTKDEAYAGAYVKDPQTGMHKYVVSFDLNSLYPKLIEMYNISPETIIPQEYKSVDLEKLLTKTYDLKYLQEQNMTLAANGHHFRRDKQGFLGEIMAKMYDDRVVYKDKMMVAKQNLEKVYEEMKRRGL